MLKFCSKIGSCETKNFIEFFSLKDQQLPCGIALSAE